MFVPGGNAHIIVNGFDKPLKRFAVPLGREGVGIDLQREAAIKDVREWHKTLEQLKEV